MQKKIMQNKFIVIIFIIIALSICSSPLITSYQVYVGDDALYHILRIKEFSNNLLNGKIFPNIYANTLDGYGYASAFFYPELTLIIPAILYIIGFDINIAINISICIYNILTGFIVYSCSNTYLKDLLNKEENISWLSLMATIFYITYPYRQYNLLKRFALSEFIAICFIPLVFLSMYKIFIKKEFKYWKMLSISFTLSLLTHLITTLMLGIILLIFIILNNKLLFNKKFLKSMLKAICCSVLASSYFLFPLIEQMLSNEFFYTTLPKIDDPYIYLNQTIDKKALVIVNGYLNQTILILINILILFLFFKISKKISRKNKDNKIIIVVNSALILIYVTLMQTDIFPWATMMNIFPIILKIQFPFRLYALTGIAYALMLSIVMSKTNWTTIKKITVIILLAFISKDMIINHHVATKTIQEKFSQTANSLCYLGFGEYLPSKIPPEYKKYIKNRGNTIVVEDINNNIEQIKRDFKESHTQYTIDNLNNQIKSLELPLIYYKGYAIKENENNIQIKESDNGLIQLENIPNKKIDIEIYYKGTVIQKISNIITIIFLFRIIYKKDLNLSINKIICKNIDRDYL